MAVFCTVNTSSIAQRVQTKTHGPGLGEAEQFSDLSERVGVKLEVVLGQCQRW